MTIEDCVEAVDVVNLATDEADKTLSETISGDVIFIGSGRVLRGGIGEMYNFELLLPNVHDIQSFVGL